MKKFLYKISMKHMVVFMFVVVIPAILLYNLDTSPRPWHDEGNAMLLARTLAEDGVYAVKTSTGYQTFGAVQSIGPTIILPMALVFKFFGVGILQGRLIAVLYTFSTLFIIYKLMNKLLGTYSAILALLILLGSASSQFLYFGRQALGEVPALGLFLGGWYFWWLGKEGNKIGLLGVAGILFGLSMVTKSSYVVIGGAVLGVMALLDLIYYRQKGFMSVVMVAIVSVTVFLFWVFFQRLYFGSNVFMENLRLLSQLGEATTGFSVPGIIERVKFLFNSKNDYFYFLWGIPALIYAVFLSLQKDIRGFVVGALTVFVGLWLMYYFYSVPWPSYLFASAAVTALFLGKLLFDLISRLGALLKTVTPNDKNSLSLGLFVSLVVAILFLVLYPLQNAVQFYVLNQDNLPNRVTNFLNSEVPENQVVETWERELGVMTDHLYHYPDQSMLAKVHATIYRGAPQDYLLGKIYFDAVKPSYLVIGWYAKEFQIYDWKFLEANATLVGHFDEGYAPYEIYKINYPLVDTK